MGCIRSKVTEERTIESAEDIVIHAGMFVKMNPKTRLFLDEYTTIRPLGEGAFSQVSLCAHKSLGIQRAVKVYNKESLQSKEAKAQFKNELKILRCLDHPNIIKVFEAFEDQENYYLVMEHCQGGNLLTKLMQSPRFSEEEAAKIMKQLFSCIRYLHSYNIAHRDIKPENIMFDEDQETIKIIDFAHSTNFYENMFLTNKVGSPYYAAPEVWSGEYTEKCDLWSAGVILYILLRGRLPFYGKKPGEIQRLIKKRKLDLNDDKWNKISEGAKSLVRNLLVLEDKRPSAKNALEDPWITDSATFSEPPSATFRHVMDNMSSLETSNKLVDAVQMFITTQLLTSQESSDSKAIFRFLDTDGDGKLSRNEVENAFKRFKNDSALAKEQAERLMNTIDTSQSGFVDYTEFLKATTDSVQHVSDEKLEAAFYFFDREKKGYISVLEIEQALSGRIDSRPDVWESIIRRFHSSGETIGLQEFKDAFH